MFYKKLFFPIGAGDDIASRIYGALLVNKFFGSHIEIMSCQLDPQIIYNVKMTLRGGKFFDEFLQNAKQEMQEEKDRIFNIFKQECEKLEISISNDPTKQNSANLIHKTGNRSNIVANVSKYCDLVVAATPLDGKITGTYEAAVLKSGKNSITIPRNLKKFKPEKIIVSLTGTPQSTRSLTNSMFLLKQAKEVCCITSENYISENPQETQELISDYLKMHGVKASFKIVETTKTPGEALLYHAHNFGADLIVAAANDENGIREVFLGSASKYYLKNTDLPSFM